ncbi:hypothetical protein MHM93_01610 [Pseudoalteromonas sp. MM17-2]|uniref:hypothetical protein n=1 Tax=Pseudoalteromonas sp. MM17-2 TaxID=2917753 RepID=UPI001EF57B22|nr:hypothetical protein [Pseudoalteromonas sp. MM17-2]MCG7542876.1 hypothetical protein [Pseudoalteromonas sp. MM17-2]
MKICKDVSLIIFTMLALQACVSADIVYTETHAIGDKSKITEDAKQVFHHDGNYKWAGIVVGPVVPLPIPLTIPYGQTGTTSWIVDGKTVYSEYVTTKVDGATCTILIGPYCGTEVTWGNLLFGSIRWH